MAAPIANDSGIESSPIPKRIPAPPPFLSAIKSAIVNTMAPPIKANTVAMMPILFSASMTIEKMAAEMRMPAPNAVSARI
jgi:hypothetical protein